MPMEYSIEELHRLFPLPEITIVSLLPSKPFFESGTKIKISFLFIYFSS